MQGTLKTLNRWGVRVSVHLAQAQSYTCVGPGSGSGRPGQGLGDTREDRY